MTELIGRRDVVRLAGLAGLGAALGGCASPAPGPAPSGGGSAAATSPGATTSHGATSHATPSWAQLEKQLSGTLARPGQRGYRPKTLLYNPRFFSQPEPEAIAHVATGDDVAACVRFAADGGAPLRIRNGGHSYGGWSSGPGLVVDLADLNRVVVDGAAMTATIGAGALLADVYSELGARGVSIGGGSCATVGVTGLTLGGGVGVLARAYGLTCDQLTAVRAVTADGKVRTVDANTDPDLFWALRGGGGSFAAVTELTFDVRPAPRVQTFFLQWSWSAAAEVLAAWQDWIAKAPRELWSTCKLLVDPGKGGRVLVAGTWLGAGSPDARLSALLRLTPEPTVNDDGGGSYKGVAAIVAAAGLGLEVPGIVEGGVSFDAFGGAIADLAPDATAFPWRTALADVQYTATWPYADAGRDPAPFDDFVQSERRALQPWVGASAYVNYADRTLTDFATAYWGPNLPRLSRIKKRYDPGQVFSFPQSVPLP